MMIVQLAERVMSSESGERAEAAGRMQSGLHRSHLSIQFVHEVRKKPTVRYLGGLISESPRPLPNQRQELDPGPRDDVASQ